MFDIIMSHEKEIYGQDYSINYSYIDVRPMNFQRKMDIVLTNNDENAVLESKDMSDTDLQTLFSDIVWNAGDRIEIMHGLQKIVDNIFLKDTQYYFKIQTAVYIVGFVLPFMFAEFFDYGICHDKTSSDIWIGVALLIASIT